MSDAALSSLQMQSVLSRRMEIIADNIANMSTPGFKAEMMAVASESDGASPSDTTYTVDLGLSRKLTPGKLAQTGNSLDVAIHGEGYFVVETPAGERFTRNGRFSINAEGQLVTTRGQRVLSVDGGPIQIPADQGRITVSRDGTISTGRGAVAVLGVVSFANENKMIRTGAGLLRAETPPVPAEKALVVQGAVEESNVEPVIQITEMMKVMRGYQSAQRIIDAEHERLRKAIQSLTQLG